MSGYDIPSPKALPASLASTSSESLPPPPYTVKDRCRSILKSLKQKLSRKDKTHRTGLSLEFQQRRDDNARKSGLNRLPVELFLRIMTLLGPVELYVARQSCAVFLRAFEIHDFSEFHRPIASGDSRRNLLWRNIALRLSNDKYSAIHQRLRDSEARHGPAPAGAFWPIIDLNRNYISKADETEIAQLVRRDFLCQPYLATPIPALSRALSWREDNALSSIKDQVFCARCKRSHNKEFFSDTQLVKKFRQRKCIAWEGKMEVCPHRHVSLGNRFYLFKGKRAVPLTCAECKLIFRADRGEKCPTLVAAGDVRSVVTKDLIRQGLEGLEARFGNQFFCPHLTFHDRKLMVPFEWYRCVCFRDPTRDERQECYRHDHKRRGGDPTCCACRALKHPEAVGRFMT
ncbi:hypothetical protein CMUS01_13567 [Colletotrichum musicola]|uniref:F-box domain-containing protein n=1 Tax=Colletotrichum musicola TaxID=2175873 RepID=A0A8H6JBR5_9PEZI|nr:hypothetical protein CMUS01_13567 [Colletotrichum musicola]